MDIETARRVLNRPNGLSDVYVEMNDPVKSDEVAQLIEKSFPDFDARSMNEFQNSFGNLMGQLDRVLGLTVSLALAVGVSRKCLYGADRRGDGLRPGPGGCEHCQSVSERGLTARCDSLPALSGHDFICGHRHIGWLVSSLESRTSGTDGSDPIRTPLIRFSLAIVISLIYRDLEHKSDVDD